MKFLTSPWLTIRVQLALGAIFVAAALPKIADPPSFAHMVYNYRVLPGGLVNITALLMPWVEIIAGMALIVGVWTRPARNLIAAMLVVFIVAIAFNLMRDNAIDCGCFDLSAAGRTHEERLTDMRWVIIRDIGMLMMVAQLSLASRVRNGEVTPAAEEAGLDVRLA
ncbi:MAG TPA: MauE/DoxX family redox-associated membrane protein [Thermoanaerobaculia bacterium]|nr:MauE/DoxX family redox-associated membrane protein [Thermoanaerobaculia bacterium]